MTSLVEYARYSWLAGLRWQTFTWMDTIVLAFFVNRTLIGVYEVSWNLATVLALISVSIRRTLFPEMSELGVTEDYGRIKHYLTEGLSFAGIFAIPGFFGALVVGPRLLSIYGPAFQRGAVVLLVLILVRLVATYESLFLSTLNAIDHPDTTFRINVLFIVTNVSLNVLLVWLFGWIGAAVASLVAMSVALVANYIALTALIGAPSLPFGDIVYEVVAAASMAFVLRVLLSRVPASTFTTILLVGFGAVVYLTVLVGLSPTVREKAVSLV
ncbi:MAG: polysaccharide biosynthesis C-terminal domain-containing protein [Haloplanus sp.]